MTSIPSLNVTPRTSFGNWLWPSRRRQLFCAASSSLKTIASAVLLDRHPFDRIVRWRTVAKVLSMGLVVRRCFEPRRHVEPAPLQVEQQIAPVLRALAGAIGEADQFLAAFRRRADQHQDALLFVFEPCLEMDAIGPDVDVALR